MRATTIHHILNDNQYQPAKDGQQMTERMFVSNLIREYAKPSTDGYSLHVSDLDPIDQKHLLSYCVSADTYEWACQNSIRLGCVIQEYAADMQSCIDEI